MSDLVQLVYVSRAAGSSRPDLDDILAASRRRNAAAGITGFLLAGPTWFAQILEGAAETVGQTYARIAADPRHTDIVPFGTRPMRRRSFPRWSMGGRTIDEDFEAMLSRHGLAAGLDPRHATMPALLALALDLQDLEPAA